MRVLFVDDDKHVRELIETFCATLEISFDIATSADEAISFVSDSKYPLVVTDLNMANHNGVELADKIKEMHPDTTIFAFTGDSNVFNLRQLKRIFDKVYFKPCDYSRMIGEVMKHLAVKKYPFLG